jgi:gluconokinase
MKYYLGVDIGTTSAKCVAFSESGEVMVSASRRYEMLHPKINYSEQDPDEIFTAMVESVNEVTGTLNSDPEFVAFSAAMHSLIVMGDEGRPLTNCIIWADNRAAEIADELRNTERGRGIYESTGVPVHAMSPLCKILWYKQNDPEVFDAARQFIGIKEYVFYKLFGAYVTETSIASTTGMLNLETLDWDEDVVSFAGIDRSQLPEVRSVRTFFRLDETKARPFGLKLPHNIAFVLGGSDGALANLGTFATAQNTMAISIGTSSAARIVTTTRQMDADMRTFCYHLMDNCFIVGGPSNNGAIVLEWLRDNLLETSESLESLFEKAETIEAGSGGLIFVPYLLGERAPVWDSSARGIFYGFDINHRKAHLIRACMEGVIYSVYSTARILLHNNAITEIHATGGFTQSRLWLQMLADVCGLPVLVSSAVESSSLGAVMIGLTAMNIERLPPREVLEEYKPDITNHAVYMERFRQFDLTYQQLKRTNCYKSEMPAEA